MGQRLVINVFENKESEKEIANIYYHWSGYSYTAMNEMYNLLTRFDESEYESNIEKIVDAVQRNKYILPYDNKNTYGSISIKDYEIFKEKYPDFKIVNKERINRNQGLVAITEETMESHLGWAEMISTVYLDELQCDIGSILYSPYFELMDDEYLPQTKLSEDEIKSNEKYNKNKLDWDEYYKSNNYYSDIIINEYPKNYIKWNKFDGLNLNELNELMCNMNNSTSYIYDGDDLYELLS